MSNTILIRRGSGTPTYSDFTEYELAYDYTNDKLYIRDGNAMVEIGSDSTNSTANSSFLTGDSLASYDGYIMTKGIVNENETGTAPAAITFGNGATYANDNISLITSGATALFVNASGNVGIGGTAANRDLQINGTGIIRLKDADGDPGLDFGDAEMQLRYRTASDKLQVYSYGTTSNVLTIQKSNGNVGIAEESPDTLLHIKNSGSGSTSTLKLEDNARLMYLGRDAIAVQDLSGNAAQLYINSNTTFSGSITTGGNATIGGTASVTSSITTGYGLALNNGNTNFLLYNNSGENVLYMRDTTNSAMIQTWGVNSVQIHKGLTINETGGNHDTRIEGDTDTHLFFADASTDRIGIGTSSPSQKLEVAGAIKATGTGGFTIGNVAGLDRIQNSSNSFSFLTDGNAYANMTFGTVTAGTWQGSAVAVAYGGTGATSAHNARINLGLGTLAELSQVTAATIADNNVGAAELNVSGNGSSGQVLASDGDGSFSWVAQSGGAVSAVANGSNNRIATFSSSTALNGESNLTFDGTSLANSDGDVYLNTDNFSTQYRNLWTRVGYGDSGTAYWHKLCRLVITGSYKDYNMKVLWTSRYDSGILHLHLNSDNDNNADVDYAYVQSDASMALSGNAKSNTHFKYTTPDSSTVDVWVYTPGWRELDYIRIDSITEGEPSVTFYDESTTTQQTSDPGGTAFSKSNILTTQTGVTAAQVTSGTFADARIPNLAASKITSGELDTARVNWDSTDKTVRWDNGRGYHGNPRSMAIGYSGGNYGQFGYNINFTTTSGQHTYAFNDIATRCDLYDGLQVYTSVSGGSAGSTISWTELMTLRNGEFSYKENTIWHAGNDGPGSGLNADLLDNLGAGSFLRSDTGDTAAGNITFTAKLLGDTSTTSILNGASVTNVNNGFTNDIGTGKAAGLQPFRYSNNSTNTPLGDGGSMANNANWGLSLYSHGTGGGGNYGLQMSGGDNDNQLFFIRRVSNGSFGSWFEVWHSGNDGGGSGLDADKLDGVQGSSFLRSDATDTATGALTFSTQTWNGHITWNNGKNIYVGGESSFDVSGSGVFQIWDSGTGAPFIKCDVGQRVEIGQAGSRGLKVHGDFDPTGTHYVRHGGSDYSPNISFLGASNVAGSNSYENAGIGYYDNSGTGSMKFFGNRNAMSWFFTDSDETLFNMASDGTFHAEADVVAYSQTTNSDRRLKENINPIQYGLKEVLEINPVKYKWIEKRGGKEDIGVIAQDIEKIIPEIVQENKALNSDEMIKSVDYGKMVAVLIKAVQEQQEQINELKEKLNG